MISIFPKGSVLNKALAWIGPCWSLSDDLHYLLPDTYSYPHKYLFSHTYPYVQSVALPYLPKLPTL